MLPVKGKLIKALKFADQQQKLEQLTSMEDYGRKVESEEVSLASPKMPKSSTPILPPVVAQAEPIPTPRKEQLDAFR